MKFNKFSKVHKYYNNDPRSEYQLFIQLELHIIVFVKIVSAIRSKRYAVDYNMIAIIKGGIIQAYIFGETIWI